MGPYKDWRDLLREITKNPQYRATIIEALGINPITLGRWLNNVTDPHPENFRRLYLASPEKFRPYFVQVNQRKAGTDQMIDLAIEERKEPFSYAFYQSVLTKRATLPDHLRFFEMSNFILSHARRQLAPENTDLCLWLLRCTPPSGPNKQVRSLVEILAMPTPPWPNASLLRRDTFLMGAESIAGRALMYSRWQTENFFDQDDLDYVRPMLANSIAAVPIMYATRLAGVLVALSTQTDFFYTEEREYMLKGYANAFALAFRNDEFYRLDDIALHMFPSQRIQQDYIKNEFQEILKRTTYKTPLRLSNLYQELDFRAYQLLEEKLIQKTFEPTHD